jgi:hypothetical protein
MDAINTVPGDGDAPPGELIVQNGRQAGARRPIVTPITLLGRAQGCDLRLNVEDVHPLHCALIPSSNGIVLRDLGSETGTFVNEQRVITCLLRDGDLLSVGPFRLLVRWFGAVSESIQAVPSCGEVEALRVQAAAVAAQQAALMEQENRLQQRCCGLEKQEEQLGAHLEEKRRRLVDLTEDVKKERAQLKVEQEGLEQKRVEILSAAERDRQEAAETLKKAKTERERLWGLRRRMHKRWKAEWGRKEEQLRRREKEVESRALAMEREQKRLEDERAKVDQMRLKVNGDRELTRCEVRERWQLLRQAEQQAQAEQERRLAEMEKQKRKLEKRARVVQEMEQALAARQQETETLRDELAREAEGLETRVQNLRQAMLEMQPRRETTSATPSLPPLAAEAESARWLHRLEAVAADLADQRLALVEQWKTFIQTQQSWCEEQASVFPKLEETAKELEERERLIRLREEELHAQGLAMHERQQALAKLRGELEAWQAQLTIRENVWKGERATLLLRTQREEDAARKRQLRLDELRKQWAARRKQEVARLSIEMQRCRELQQQYATLREEFEKRAAEMGAEHRTLAERTLALEQLEMERVGRSDDPVTAEKRLQKYRRQIALQQEEAEHRLTERGKHLDEESSRLTAQTQHLQQRLEVTTETEAALSSRQTEWEHRLMEAEHARDFMQREVQRLQQQERMMEKRLQEVQGELDRLIAIMLQDMASPPAQAA